MDLTKILRDADLDERVIYSRKFGIVKVAAVTEEGIACIRTGGLLRWNKEGRINGAGDVDLYPDEDMSEWKMREDLPDGTTVVVNSGKNDNWLFRIYAHDGKTYTEDGRDGTLEQWRHIIPARAFSYAEKDKLSGSESDYGQAF